MVKLGNAHKSINGEHHPLVAHVDTIQYELKNHDKDRIEPVLGPERMGKSGLGHLVQSMSEPDWDPREQLHWTGRSYRAAAPQLKKGQTNRLDEAIRGGQSFKFMDPENIANTDFWVTCGAYNLHHLICYPNVRWLTPILKEHRAFTGYQVKRRYPNSHTVCQILQFRDEDVIFDKPRVYDTFDAPKPEGWKWDLEADLKKIFTDAVSKGRGDEYDGERAMTTRIYERLGIFYPDADAGQ